MGSRSVKVTQYVVTMVTIAVICRFIAIQLFNFVTVYKAKHAHLKS